MPLWLRRCVGFACLLAAWFVARPAHAAAPVCDERGASMLAPLPILDAPDASVDVGERTDGCDGDTFDDQAYHRGERSHRLPQPTDTEAVITPPPRHFMAPPTDLGRASEAQDAERAGVRSELERPPR